MRTNPVPRTWSRCSGLLRALMNVKDSTAGSERTSAEQNQQENQEISLCFVTLACRFTTAVDTIGPIGAFIQTNLVGLPVLHEPQTWEFDPEVSLKRRRQFISLHGDKGEKLIERLGLGEDGLEEERLRKQRQRDEGHLGGLNYFLP